MVASLLFNEEIRDQGTHTVLDQQASAQSSISLDQIQLSSFVQPPLFTSIANIPQLNPPSSGSDAAGLQSIVDSADKNKAQVIADRQANLPLPEQPPTASDFNSSDQRTVDVGSGRISGGSDGNLRNMPRMSGVENA
ncbi:unnamed protein product [Zymoseptoria tritici ST99CH_1A5]|uniref:Uncharacterized protein n=1 Tax=Zymoseptoria tritici ST99CH_1A5 TaxID=1276529 RepID=A0A1Y6L6H7_ZYMTR|nr:unnamed protein product [Zymoseptoria tritici ST99CH_1A5]